MLHPSLQSRLENQHLALIDKLENVPASILKTRIVPGKWTVQENLAHLVSYQPVFLERMQLILTQPDPAILPYQADTDPLFAGLIDLPLEEVILEMKKGREQVLNLIGSLSPAEFARKGAHPVYGNLSILGWTEFFILHESHHMFTMYRLLAQPLS
ncbi:DinB family protein [Chitinophaga caeni]|nr:DinB family protein [Chitinophaga caeni]